MTKRLVLYGLVFLSVFVLSIINFNSANISESITANAGLELQEDAIPISTCEELQNISNNLEGNYYLTQDIDCSTTEKWNWNGSAYLGFEPIGSVAHSFSGTFDGGGYSIRDLYINRSFESTGMFSYLSGKIFNLNIVNFSVSNSQNITALLAGTITSSGELSFVHIFGGESYSPSSNVVAGFAGYHYGLINKSSVEGVVLFGRGKVAPIAGDVEGDIFHSQTTDCSVTSFYNWHAGGFVGVVRNNGYIYNSTAVNPRVVSSYDGTGGFAGQIKNSRVKRCSAINVSVFSSGPFVGGFAGVTSDDAVLKESYATGEARGLSHRTGGLIGHAIHTTISDCYSHVNVSGGTYVGGLVGWLYLGCILENSYSTGFVSGSYPTGGLVASITSSSVSNSFWDVNTSNQSSSVAGTGLSSFELKSAPNYVGRWNISHFSSGSRNNGYPFLAWQNSDSDNSVWFINDELPFSKGFGTESDPFIITTCEELQNMNMNLTASYALGKDIDCSDTVNWNKGAGFVPIGFSSYNSDSKTFSSNSFRGNFDGRGHVITDLHINRTGFGSDDERVGLFGMSSGSKIKRVGLIDPILVSDGSSHSYATGFFIGRGLNVELEDVFVDGGMLVSNSQVVGGLVGYLGYTPKMAGVFLSLVESFTKTTILIDDRAVVVGGLVGEFGGYAFSDDRPFINNSYSLSLINSTNAKSVGGLVGYQRDKSIVSNSYSSSTFFGNENVDRVGGLVGYTREADCDGVWNYELANTNESACGDPVSTYQLKNLFEYLNHTNNTDVDISLVNISYNDGYPFLAWEINNTESKWLISQKDAPTYEEPEELVEETPEELFVSIGVGCASNPTVLVVSDSSDFISSASINLVSEEYTDSGQTDNQGVYSTLLRPGNYSFTISKSGYDSISGSFEVGSCLEILTPEEQEVFKEELIQNVKSTFVGSSPNEFALPKRVRSDTNDSNTVVFETNAPSYQNETLVDEVVVQPQAKWFSFLMLLVVLCGVLLWAYLHHKKQFKLQKKN